MARALGKGGAMPGPIFFIGAFTTSWIAGFVVPGAPAGLGVREVVLTAWLAGALPPATAVLLVVALRIATTIADSSEEHTSELQSLMRISYVVSCLNKNKRSRGRAGETEPADRPPHTPPTSTRAKPGDIDR